MISILSLVIVATPFATDDGNLFAFLLTYIVAPILVAVIIAIGKLIISDKVLSVKEIKNPTSTEINSFIDLYNNRIDIKYRICVEEILSFVGESNNAIRHHLYVCKRRNKTVGFIKFMISETNRYIFIAYVAIDNTDDIAKKYGLNKLLKKLFKKYFKPRIVDSIITEVEKGSLTYYTAFSRLIGRYANAYGKNAYILDFNYTQPNMPDDNYNMVPEEIMHLIFIPYYTPLHTTISKSLLLELIGNLYFDIYCPSCNSITNCCEKDYRDYLNKLLNNYNESLLSNIKMLPINFH